MYRGKDGFEKDFVESAKSQDCKVLRLYDTTNGYAGVANPCDFITTDGLNMLMIECKVTHGKSLPITCITEKQYNELLEWDALPGCIGGILVCYVKQDSPIDCRVYFVQLTDLDSYLKTENRKSLPQNVAADLGISLGVRLKRTHITMDLKTLMHTTRRLSEWYND